MGNPETALVRFADVDGHVVAFVRFEGDDAEEVGTGPTPGAAVRDAFAKRYPAASFQIGGRLAWDADATELMDGFADPTPRRLDA